MTPPRAETRPPLVSHPISKIHLVSNPTQAKREGDPIEGEVVLEEPMGRPPLLWMMGPRESIERPGSRNPSVEVYSLS